MTGGKSALLCREGTQSELRNGVVTNTILANPWALRGTAKEERMEAYCLKCRTKREMKTPKAITMKNGKPATEGVCPVCSTRMFKIGKA